MTRIVVVGDSHIGPMARGLTRWLQHFHRIQFCPLGGGSIVREEFFSLDDNRQHVTIRAGVRQPVTLPAANTASDLYALSLPLNTSRILRDYNWQNFVPWNLANDTAEIPLSDEAVLRLIKSDADRAIAFAIALSKVGIDLVVVEAPMFFEDARYLKNSRREVYAEVANRYRRYVIGRLLTSGICVIEQPAGTLTLIGTTNMAYNHEDPEDVHHANAKFGRLMLKEIVKYDRRRRLRAFFQRFSYTRTGSALARSFSRFLSASEVA